MYLDRRLWRFTEGLRGRLALAAGVGVAGALTGVLRLALLGWLLAEAIAGMPLDDLLAPAVAIALVMVLRGLIETLRARLADQVAHQVQRRLRAHLFDHICGLGPGWVAGTRTGATVQALVDGVNQLESFFGRYMPQLAVAAVAPVLLFLMAAALDATIAAILLVAALAALALPGLFHRREQHQSLAQSRAMRAYAARFLDAVQGLATLQAFGQSRARGRVLARDAEDLSAATMRVLATSTATRGITDLCVAGGAAVALVVGAGRIADGQMALSTLVVVLLAGVEMFRPMRELRELLHQGMLGQAAAQAIHALLDERPAVPPAGGVRPSGPISPELRFDAVRFAYPGGRGDIHAGVDFHVAPGERVAIVGPSGAGKTTVLKLLTRQHDPDAGRITVGGHAVADLAEDVLRAQFAVVSQDPWLFHGTVEDSLRLGRPDADAAALWRALEAAGAAEFVRALPAGLATVVGERGVRLSGGQRQRLAIARALLRDAPILILDEALSAVDAENEAAIQAALDRLMVGRTTLVVAHRLSSVIGADRILVLDQGRIVEAGRHGDLMAAGGLYARLMASQVRDAQAPDDIVLDATVASPATVDHATAPLARPVVEIAEPPPGWGPVLGALAGFVRPWARLFAIVVALGIGRVVAFIGVGVLGALTVAEVAQGRDPEWRPWALLALAPIAALAHWLESWLAHDMAFRMLAVMRVTLFTQLDRLSPAFLMGRQSGDLVTLATQDVDTVEYFFAHTVAPAIVAVLVPSVVLIALAWIAWPVALVWLPFLGFAAANPFVARSRIDRAGVELRQAAGDLGALGVAMIQGLGEILQFQQAPRLRDHFLALSDQVAAARAPLQHDLARQSAMLEITTGLGGLAVALTGVWLAGRGEIAIAIVPLLSVIAMAAFLQVSEIAQAARQLAETYGAARRLAGVHRTRPVVADTGAAASPATGDLVFAGARFTYPTGVRPALDGLDLAVAAGATVALVGPSGAGKSTVANLALRFFDPAEGRVSLGGVDLRDLPLDILRGQVSLVAQDVFLFDASLGDNVRLARPEASDAEVMAALDRAALGDFARALPEGLATRVGERGARLSGGQRQRVGIARAFLKDAPILILDEATSHLDAISEAEVRQALTELKRGRATLVIAHRLSTVRDADLIAVLDRGRVVEQGGHAALLAAGGLYARLVGRQRALAAD